MHYPIWRYIILLSSSGANDLYISRLLLNGHEVALFQGYIKILFKDFSTGCRLIETASAHWFQACSNLYNQYFGLLSCGKNFIFVLVLEIRAFYENPYFCNPSA